MAIVTYDFCNGCRNAELESLVRENCPGFVSVCGAASLAGCGFAGYCLLRCKVITWGAGSSVGPQAEQLSQLVQPVLRGAV